MAASSEEILTPAEKQTQTETKPWESDLERSDTMETTSDHPAAGENAGTNESSTESQTTSSNSSQAAETSDSDCVRQTECKEEGAVVEEVATNGTNRETEKPVITNDMYRKVVNERDKLYYELQASKQQVC